MGRNGSLMRLMDLSLFNPTMRIRLFFLADWRYLTWPRCIKSKQPLVKAMVLLCRRRVINFFLSDCREIILDSNEIIINKKSGHAFNAGDDYFVKLFSTTSQMAWKTHKCDS